MRITDVKRTLNGKLLSNARHVRKKTQQGVGKKKHISSSLTTRYSSTTLWPYKYYSSCATNIGQQLVHRMLYSSVATFNDMERLRNESVPVITYPYD